MDAIILQNAAVPAEMSTSTGYFLGAIIALLILGYLIYSLIKPEKF
jgi:K+-transporting ATPase KdpF subunit